jgi:hypothetical protein
MKESLTPKIVFKRIGIPSTMHFTMGTTFLMMGWKKKMIRNKQQARMDVDQSCVLERM